MIGKRVLRRLDLRAPHLPELLAQCPDLIVRYVVIGLGKLHSDFPPTAPDNSAFPGLIARKPSLIGDDDVLFRVRQVWIEVCARWHRGSRRESLLKAFPQN